LQVNNYKKLKLENDIKDEGCKILNEILLENKTIEKLRCNLLKIIKGNKISSIGLLNMKESLMKNKILKEICINVNNDQTNILNNEFHLVYKLLKLTKNKLNLNFSNNIYFKSDDILLKLNFLKCFIDEIDHLFFSFHHFDFIIIFLY
jgi:hypothetical protein